MRAHEFIVEKRWDRRPRLTDEMRKQQKIHQRKLEMEEKRKASLLVAMYGTDRYHEQEMRALERRAAEVELERQELEVAAMRRDLGVESRDRIKVMARAARKNRLSENKKGLLGHG